MLHAMDRLVVLAFATAFAACKRDAPPAPDGATSAPPSAASSEAPQATAAPSTHASSVALDAGTTACKTLDGPASLARPGPFAVVERMGSVDFYAEEGGRPVLAGSMHVDPRAGLPTAAAPPVGPPSTRSGKPPCAAAGTYVFCMNSEGEIRRFRTTASGVESDNFVARARPGTRIAAAMASGARAVPPSTGHTLVAYLRDRTTSEGRVSEAWVESDDGTELRLSEDGAGATTVALAPRGAGAIATYVDARRAMSPVHARTITVAPKLALGVDAVVFIAGSAEPGTRVALGVSGASAFPMLAIAHDLGFGLATLKIDGEPKADAPVLWNDYPNGLDPAPVAATASAHDPVFVARVRPSEPKFGAPHVLELGKLDGAASFVSLGVLPTTGEPRDVAIAEDGLSGFVLAYTDSAGAHAARLSCENR